VQNPLKTLQVRDGRIARVRTLLPEGFAIRGDDRQEAPLAVAPEFRGVHFVVDRQRPRIQQPRFPLRSPDRTVATSRHATATCNPECAMAQSPAARKFADPLSASDSATVMILHGFTPA